MMKWQCSWVVAVSALVLSAAARAAPEAELWEIWLPADVVVTEPIDHSGWQRLLDRYLVSADDGIMRFDYQRVSREDRGKLEDYIAGLAEMDPRKHAPPEQMAYWINLYNALTVRVVLENPDKQSITRMGRGLFSFGPWNDDVITVAGHAMTLNDIEHRILRPIWRDHRIHYAVNCASLGCPDLLPNAFTGNNLETLLLEAERRYINHPRGVDFVSADRLVVSAIFDWYLEDFAADDAALLAYLAAHHNRLSAQLVGYTGRIRYEYDWSLNGVPDSTGSVSEQMDSDQWDDAADDEWMDASDAPDSG